jgi:hypothetical protein
MILTPTAVTVWIERYETLRRHVLQSYRIFDNEPLSLVLWLAHGMAGWMRHWAIAMQMAASPAATLPPLRLAATSLWQQQLTLLLAQITLQRLYPAPCL